MVSGPSQPWKSSSCQSTSLLTKKVNVSFTPVQFLHRQSQVIYSLRFIVHFQGLDRRETSSTEPLAQMTSICVRKYQLQRLHLCSLLTLASGVASTCLQSRCGRSVFPTQRWHQQAPRSLVLLFLFNAGWQRATYCAGEWA